MLTARIIPCLDVRDGRIVKGVQFTDLRDAGDPVERAAMYESEGADELVLLDVSATTEARGTAIETVGRVRSNLSIPLTVGGGIRKVCDAARLLDAGADKVSVNTAAVQQPELLSGIAGRFGVQCTVLAVDAARKADDKDWTIVVRSGTQRTDIDAIEWARHGESLGAGEILLTSWDRDGTRCGYDTQLIAAVRESVNIPIIASGGAATCEHMTEALHAGADAVLAASIFHDSETTVRNLKQSLARSGVEVRQ